MSGWIQMHRSMLQWEWFTDVNTCHLFHYLLLKANYKTTRWRNQDILPGQLLTGRRRLSDDTGMSEQCIRTSILRLKSTSEITIRNFNKYSIITITKWSDYQLANQQTNQQLTSDSTSNQPATNQQLTTSNKVINKQSNKVKNIYTPEFEKFWGVYGSIGTKKDASIAFNKIKGVDYEAVIRGVERYQAYARANADWYSPQHASTWLNKRGWESEWQHQERKPAKSAADASCTEGILLALSEYAK